MSSIDLETGETRLAGTTPSTAGAPLAFLFTWAGRLGRSLPAILLTLVPPTAIVLLWITATERQWVSIQVLPPPAWVFQTFLDLVGTGEILSGVVISFTRIAWGLAIGATLGFFFGLLLGF